MAVGVGLEHRPHARRLAFAVRSLVWRAIAVAALAVERAEEILAEEVPAAVVYHYSKVDMINPAVKGLPLENVTNAWYAKDLYRIAE